MFEQCFSTVKSIEFFYGVESVVRGNATHYSTEPLTTGPDYDPLRPSPFIVKLY